VRDEDGNRTVDNVADDLVHLACAGITSKGDLQERTAKRVRALVDEACNLVQDRTRAESRKSLGRAWGAWLHLMMSTSLPSSDGRSLLEDVFDLEPGLREQFTAALGIESRERA
jgi:hypothetical protein